MTLFHNDCFVIVLEFKSHNGSIKFIPNWFYNSAVMIFRRFFETQLQLSSIATQELNLGTVL